MMPIHTPASTRAARRRDKRRLVAPDAPGLIFNGGIVISPALTPR
jgi:hypothetical protein